MANLLDLLATERDLCANERADDIAKLLDDAIVEIERLRAITAQAIQVRAAQKVYFRDRTQSNLVKSKDAEKELDELIGCYIITNIAVNKQTQLL